MWRVVPFVVSALVSSACDGIWDLEHIDPGPPDAACTMVGHDEDNDGLDDGCDPCPFADDNTSDADGDGIAGICDPEPSVSNTVVLFSGFDPPTRTHFALTDGAFDADAYRVGVGSAMQLMIDIDPDRLWVMTGFDAEMIGASAYHEVGFIFEARTAVSGNEVNGTLCVLGRSNEDYMEVFGRQRPLADQLINHTSDAPLSVPTFHGMVRGTYDRAATPTTKCSFISGQTEAVVTGTQVPVPPIGTLALFASDVQGAFRYVFVVRKD